ncbi:MAG TPA: ATP-binding protein, partial [Bacteroidales bacterium]|nr:ATP-binding protein [Bacteroidales bacterium]
LLSLKSGIINFYSNQPDRIFKYNPSFDIHLSNPEDDRLVGRFKTESFEALGKKIKTQIKQALEIQYKERIEFFKDNNWQSNFSNYENDLHDRFVENRTRLFIGRKNLLHILDEHVEGTSRNILGVYGEPGAGKSALLAQFYKQLLANDDILLIPHFVGANPASTSHYQMLLRFCRILKDVFNITDDIPFELNKLIDTFHVFLNMATKKVVIIIDGLNQLESNFAAHSLGWLPNDFNQNVKIIASTLNGKTKEALLGKTALRLDVLPLTKAEQHDIIRGLPSVFAKTLDAQFVNMISKKIDSNGKYPAENPLYIKLLIEELRVFGSFEKLEELIQKFPASTNNMFGFLLKRLEDEHGTAIVERLFCLLECSRYGLTMKEIIDLLQSADSSKQFQLIHRQIRDYLHNRGELIDFFHQSFSKAVRVKYFNNQECGISGAGINYHRLLAEYFSHLSSISRKIDELPYQLFKSQQWEKLSVLLATPDFFKSLWEKSRIDVLHYWKVIHENSDIKITEAFSRVLENPENLRNSCMP